MTVMSHPEFDNHELVAFHEDEASGLKAIIAVHNTKLGPAMGGCRMYPYQTEEAALRDVLRLSKGMTYKSALAGIPVGGGKAVIIGHPKQDKSTALFHAMGEFINSLGGRYTTAEDSGTSVSDLAIIGQRTKFVSGVSEHDKHGGDPSPVTAYGVYKGIIATLKHLGFNDLNGRNIAIQGVGNVGLNLCQQLLSAGANVWASDINPDNLFLAKELGAKIVENHLIHSLEVDIFAPCAMGAIINSRTIKELRCLAIAGAANNQLANNEMGEELFTKGVLYAPDYVINAGGIIDVHYQNKGVFEHNIINSHVDKIATQLETIYQRSNQLGISTQSIADTMAEDIFKRGTPYCVAA